MGKSMSNEISDEMKAEMRAEFQKRIDDYEPPSKMKFIKKMATRLLIITGLVILALPYVKIVNIPFYFNGDGRYSMLIIYKEKTENPYSLFVDERNTPLHLKRVMFGDSYYGAYELPYLLFWE